jgi:hypothetical protein
MMAANPLKPLPPKVSVGSPAPIGPLSGSPVVAETNPARPAMIPPPEASPSLDAPPPPARPLHADLAVPPAPRASSMSPSMIPFDTTRRRKRLMIVITAAILLVIGGFVAITIVSQMH